MLMLPYNNDLWNLKKVNNKNKLLVWWSTKNTQIKTKTGKIEIFPTGSSQPPYYQGRLKPVQEFKAGICPGVKLQPTATYHRYSLAYNSL